MLKKTILVLFLWSVFCAVCLASSDNPDAALTNARLGLAYLKKGMYPASKDHLLTAIKEDPEMAVGWYGMAYYLEKTGDLNAADQYYRKAMSVEPHSGSAINNYGTFLCRVGKYQDAIQAFLAATHEPSYLQAASAFENAGICALKMPNNALAMQYFHQALANNPSMPFSLLSLARLNYQMGKETEAQKYFALFKSLALFGKSDSEVEKYQSYVFSSSGSESAVKALPMPS